MRLFTVVEAFCFVFFNLWYSIQHCYTHVCNTVHLLNLKLYTVHIYSCLIFLITLVCTVHSIIVYIRLKRTVLYILCTVL